MIALTSAALFTPLERIERPVVLVEDGFIAKVATRDAFEIPVSARVFDFGEASLAPGFVDLHIHGAAGYDVMQANASGLAAMEQMLANHGVTAYLPTTITAPRADTLAALSRLADAIESSEAGAGNRARPVGIHMEGPFISRTCRGVHPPEYLMTPTVDAFNEFWEASRGHVRMMTIAPELPGAEEVIALLRPSVDAVIASGMLPQINPAGLALPS